MALAGVGPCWNGAMADLSKPRAPDGDLDTYVRSEFSDGVVSHPVFRKGDGPAVIVITEMPGISPQVLGFADRIVKSGLSVALPDMFGTAGRDPNAGGKASAGLYGLGSMGKACISREFTVLAAGKSSPIMTWLRALGREEHERCGGPGVGVVGMCFTGGFALAMAADERVLAPVLSQPSLPFPFGKRRKRSIDCSPADLDVVAGRCANEGLQVLGLRFHGDTFSPPERFEFLRERLGDGFVSVELSQDDGHPDSPLPFHHSVLTGDLIDAPGEPTRDALEQVMNLFTTKLLVS
jgi:dienelactone hydrolase